MRKFDKYAQEGNEFLHELASELGHPEELEKTMIILKSTLHVLRDRITAAEAFDFMAQLPLVLKGVFVEHWKLREPDDYQSVEEFKTKIENEQSLHGETEFDWSMSTDNIAATVIRVLNDKYLSDGQLDHILKNLPKEIAEYLQEAVNN